MISVVKRTKILLKMYKEYMLVEFGLPASILLIVTNLYQTKISKVFKGTRM